MRVLVVNAGSSSLKVRVLDAGDEVVFDGDRLEKAPAADVVGHRIVHGGEHHRDAVVVDAMIEAELRALSELAPLHQAKSIAALEAARTAFPDLPHVACFDTAFHATLPPAAATYALPAEWRARWPLRRYGFHGLSHSWIARRIGAGLIVSCHLGAGASLCAIADGRSVDTTMGFTPLEGLVMATRSGSIDPGLVLWLAEHLGRADVADALEHRAGLLGLSGTADMRALLARDDHDARLALDVYAHRLRAGIAAMAAALGGIDVLAFTGGVGEHAPAIRSLATQGLAFLGIELDEARNEAVDGEGAVGAGPVRVEVITAREDLEIARQVRGVLAEG